MNFRLRQFDHRAHIIHVEPNRTPSKFDWVQLLNFFVTVRLCSSTEHYPSIDRTLHLVRVVRSGACDLQPLQGGHSVDYVHENTQKSLIYHKPFPAWLVCWQNSSKLRSTIHSLKIDMLPIEGFSTFKKKRYIIVWASGVFWGKRPFGHFQVPKNFNFQNEAYISCKIELYLIKESISNQ